MDSQQTASSDETGRGNPTVLVVEDDKHIRASITAFLKDGGFGVVEAGDARDAIRALMARADVDVVFTDVDMPGLLNGLDLARWVRDERPRMTLIVASGEPRAAEAAARLSGVTVVVPKPYDPEEVRSIIQRCHSAA